MRPSSVIVLASLAALVSLSPGCTFDEVVAGAGLPGTNYPATVSGVKERGSYIDASVEAGAFAFRLFFPANDTCRALLAPAEGLRFTWMGLMGRVSDGENRCDAVGVLSLVAWRDRQPRRSREPLPRAPSRYHEVYRDRDIVLLHGRFPLAGALGFQGTSQLVVVVPNEEPCAGFTGRGTASMEFRARGDRPLTLIAGGELCTILGIAQPPPQNLPNP